MKLTIYYNCIGVIEIPDALTLPEIIMPTRKGVSVKYEPMHVAEKKERPHNSSFVRTL